MAWCDLRLPAEGESVSAENFGFSLRKDKLRQTRRREGCYLLRSNLTDNRSGPLVAMLHPAHRDRASLQGTEKRL